MTGVQTCALPIFVMTSVMVHFNERFHCAPWWQRGWRIVMKLVLEHCDNKSHGALRWQGSWSTVINVILPRYGNKVSTDEWMYKKKVYIHNEILFSHKKRKRASLVAQWLRICLLMQETRVRALVWEDPTCRGETRPVSHNYWACASGACAPQDRKSVV